MKKNKFFIYSCFLLINLSLFSCNESEAHKDKPVFEFLETGVLKLALDSTFPNIDYQCKVVVDSSGKEWLYAIHHRTSGIPIYNLSSDDLYKTIPLKEEGPDGIETILNASIFTPDSILILPTSKVHLYLIDGSGNRKDVYNLVGRDSIRNWLQVFSEQLPQLYEGKFYYSLMPKADVARKRFNLDAPIFGFTIAKDSVAILQEVKYPPILTNIADNETYHPEFAVVSFLIHDNKLIYIIPASDTIYSFNLLTKEKKTYLSPSQFKTSRFTTIKNKQFDAVSVSRQKYEGTFYYRILYDSYRNLYYRIILLPIKAPANIRSINVFRAKPFSIQIFDSEFNCIGETFMHENKLQSGDYFIGSKGLYISNNHPDNPDYTEDSLNYTIYVPKLIK